MGLVRDHAGSLYGTTYFGGAYGLGTLFKVDPRGKETILHSFCGQANCTDGSSPAFGSLLLDASGSLYGTAARGANQFGVVFKLTP